MKILILILLSALGLFAQAPILGEYQGNCMKGNTSVVTAATNSTSKAMGSFPLCTVAVYITGSDPASFAALRTSPTGSVKANPFTANADGSYQFFTASPVVDIRMSGGGIVTPFTLGSQVVLAPSIAISDILFSTLSEACTAAASRTLFLTKIWSGLTTQTLPACNIQALTGGIIKPASGQTVTITGSFIGDLTQHVDTSAGGLVLFNGPVAAFYPQWFGPAGTCTGPAVDSVVAVQAAVDAAIGRKVELVGSPNSCGISNQGPSGNYGVTLYPTNQGIEITSNAGSPSGSYVAGAGGGLVATTVNPPTSLLTSYAQKVYIHDLYLDGNSAGATYGFVSSMGLGDIVHNLQTNHFSSDGTRVWNEYTTATNITSGGGSGSSAVTVTAVTNNRNTFGTFYCSFIVFDYGLTNPEQIQISSVAGNVLNLASPTTHTHTTVRCHGNSNVMRFTHLVSNSNGGWGFHVIPGSDSNGLYFEDHRSTNNTLGGELWHGTVHVHVGGNYEGDTGPSIQLGEVGSTASTSRMSIGPLGGVEESSSANNKITSVCDDRSSVWFNEKTLFTITTGGSACATYPSGGTTIGFGIEPTGNFPYFDVINATGTASYGQGAPFVASGASSTLYRVPNQAVECTGSGTPVATCPGASANNHLVLELIDPSTGARVANNTGLEIRVVSLAHSLQIGVNQIDVNGRTGSVLVSHFNPASGIATGYTVGAMLDMIQNGNYVDVSQ